MNLVLRRGRWWSLICLMIYLSLLNITFICMYVVVVLFLAYFGINELYLSYFVMKVFDLHVCFDLTGWSSIWCSSFRISTCQVWNFPWTKTLWWGLPEEMDWGILGDSLTPTVLFSVQLAVAHLFLKQFWQIYIKEALGFEWLVT